VTRSKLRERQVQCPVDVTGCVLVRLAHIHRDRILAAEGGPLRERHESVEMIAGDHPGKVYGVFAAPYWGA